MIPGRDQFCPYVHSDPGRYAGPAVPGWPPGADRSMGRYLDPESGDAFGLVPRGLEEEGGRPWMLVAVAATAKESQARSAVRETWASLQTRQGLKVRCQVVFLVGQARVSSATYT